VTTKPRPSILSRLVRVIEDGLPMSPAERDERDDDGVDRSDARKLRLRIHMLEKRGKGGYR
jgi:hypothetical protein